MIRISNLFHIVFKGDPTTRFVMTLEVLLWDLKGTVLSSFKVTTENHSHTIRIGKSKVATTRSTTANDLKPLSGISKSQMWEFVFNISKIEQSVEHGRSHHWTRGVMNPPPPQYFFKKILLYVCVLILAILFYKITFCFP